VIPPTSNPPSPVSREGGPEPPGSKQRRASALLVCLDFGTRRKDDPSSTLARLDFDTRRGDDPSPSLLHLRSPRFRRQEVGRTPSNLVRLDFDTRRRDSPPTPAFASISAPGGGTTLVRFDFDTRRGNPSSPLLRSPRIRRQEVARSLLQLRLPQFRHQEEGGPSSTLICLDFNNRRRDDPSTFVLPDFDQGGE